MQWKQIDLLIENLHHIETMHATLISSFKKYAEGWRKKTKQIEAQRKKWILIVLR